MNLTYLIKSLIIVAIISYDVLITKFYDFKNSVIKFIIIFLKSLFDIEND